MIGLPEPKSSWVRTSHGFRQVGRGHRKPKLKGFHEKRCEYCDAPIMTITNLRRWCLAHSRKKNRP